jgi:putative membrane protein
MLITAVTLAKLKDSIQLKRFVASIVLPRVFLISGFSALVILLHHADLPVSFNFLGNVTTNVACNLVLGLLLVFRTNTAYDRFWEGRKAWGMVVVNARNLAREMQVAIATSQPTEQAEKLAILRLLPTFAILTKQRLRRQTQPQELAPLISAEALAKLQQVKNPPLEITLWIGAYFQQQYESGRLDATSLWQMKTGLNNLIEGLTSCERISGTPIPKDYAVYLKRLTLIYSVCLPFNLVDELEWWTIAIVALICFVLYSVEQIGDSIEDPFGCDSNDLPLEELCQTILNNVEQITQFEQKEQSLLSEVVVLAEDNTAER